MSREVRSDNVENLLAKIEAVQDQPWRVRLLKTIDELQMATDEVVVSIALDGSKSDPKISVELQWLGRTFEGERLKTGFKKAVNVPLALVEAHVFGAQWGFRGVAVSMDPHLTWDPNWGELSAS